MKAPVSLERVRAVAAKEAIQIRRDPRSLALAFLLPVVLMVLFGSALSLDLDNVPLAVLDLDNTPESRELTDAFEASRYFRIIAMVERENDLGRLIDKRMAMATLTISSGFGENILTGKPAQVQVIADGSDSLSAQMALGYSRAIIEGFAPGLSANNPANFIQARVRVWYNPELKSSVFTVSGLIALIMIIIGAVLTSLTLAREWERGTMEQLLTTPVTTPEILIGKFIPYFGIGLVDLVMGILLAVLIFKVPLKGSFFLLTLLSALFLTGALAQGLLISAFARNQLLANQLAIVTSFLPAFLLSGFFAPISNMPLVIQAITFLVPARYAMTICRGIMLKGVGLAVLWPQVLFLALYGLLITTLTVRVFKRKLA